LTNNLATYSTRNFHFDGHGSETTIGCDRPSTDPEAVVIGQVEIKALLGNKDDRCRPRRSHRYRFVFLNACETANSPTWVQAFGIYPVITSRELVADPSKVQAFVGWKGSPRSPVTTSDWYDMAITYAVFYNSWMNGYPLAECIMHARQDEVFGIRLNWPLGRKYFPIEDLGFGRYHISFGVCNNFMIKVLGYPGITRNGWLPYYDGWWR